MIIGGNKAVLFATTTGSRASTCFHHRRIGHRRSKPENSGASPNAGSDSIYDPEREAQHGIQLHGPERVLIRHVTITDVYGDSVYVGRDLRKKRPTWTVPSRDVTMVDNVFPRNGRQGIAISQGSRLLIARNDISEVRRTTFDLEPNGPSWLVEDVSIEHNRVGAGRLNFLLAAGRGPVNRIRVAYNKLTGKVMNAMIVDHNGESRRNWSFIGIESNRKFGSPLIGAFVGYGVQGIVFRDNVMASEQRRRAAGSGHAAEAAHLTNPPHGGLPPA